jgi:hypothetical protein
MEYDLCQASDNYSPRLASCLHEHTGRQQVLAGHSIAATSISISLPSTSASVWA